ncbi:hypothetical protein ACSYAD_34785, partial [Acaryochloris marina NIES-2412]|uniref:hypothetical protein n=1 Tax=Acaryochloris marina TaxID=155978 RepID=UPI004057DE9E
QYQRQLPPFQPAHITPKKRLRIMSNPHNPISTFLLHWCDPQNQGAITQAILEDTTQFQFHTDRRADGSDECAEDKTTERFC